MTFMKYELFVKSVQRVEGLLPSERGMTCIIHNKYFSILSPSVWGFDGEWGAF